MHSPRHRGLFVTGTDTGVGKTMIACLIASAWRARGLDVGVMKPIETGDAAMPHGIFDADGWLLRCAASSREPMAAITPWRYAEPLAPLACARSSGIELDRTQLLAAITAMAERHRCLVVEGVGGALVPLGKDWFVADLMAEVGLAALVVGRAGLGTINHMLLTIEALQRRSIAIAGVVLNGARGELAEQGNPALLQELGSGVPLWGVVPHLSDWCADVCGAKALQQASAAWSTGFKVSDAARHWHEARATAAARWAAWATRYLSGLPDQDGLAGEGSSGQVPPAAVISSRRRPH